MAHGWGNESRSRMRARVPGCLTVLLKNSRGTSFRAYMYRGLHVAMLAMRRCSQLRDSEIALTEVKPGSNMTPKQSFVVLFGCGTPVDDGRFHTVLRSPGAGLVLCAFRWLELPVLAPRQLPITGRGS